MKKQIKPQAVDETADDNTGETVSAEPEAPAESSGVIAENHALRQELRHSKALTDLSQALITAGAHTPGLLCDAAASDLQIDTDGNVTNAAALVEHLRVKYPEQFRLASPGTIDAGAGRSAPAPLTKAALAKMSPAEITTLDWAAVRRVLSEK